MKFFAGLLLGLLIVPFGAYLYFTGGSAPVATTDSDMPFEKYFAQKAQHARIAKDMPKNVPIQPTEANYVAGAELYKQHCAVCHGLPLTPKSGIATGMYPKPPLLLEGKGVTDDEPGESYWKIFCGIHTCCRNHDRLGDFGARFRDEIVRRYGRRAARRTGSHSLG